MSDTSNGIIVSAHYVGSHREWHIPDHALYDYKTLDEATADVRRYLRELDASEPYPFNDGNGRFEDQFNAAIEEVLDRKPIVHLVMAVDDITEVEVTIRCV